MPKLCPVQGTKAAGPWTKLWIGLWASIDETNGGLWPPHRHRIWRAGAFCNICSIWPWCSNFQRSVKSSLHSYWQLNHEEITNKKVFVKNIFSRGISILAHRSILMIYGTIWSTNEPPILAQKKGWQAAHLWTGLAPILRPPIFSEKSTHDASYQGTITCISKESTQAISICWNLWCLSQVKLYKFATFFKSCQTHLFCCVDFFGKKTLKIRQIGSRLGLWQTAVQPIL